MTFFIFIFFCIFVNNIIVAIEINNIFAINNIVTIDINIIVAIDIKNIVVIDIYILVPMFHEIAETLQKIVSVIAFQ